MRVSRTAASKVRQTGRPARIPHRRPRRRRLPRTRHRQEDHLAVPTAILPRLTRSSRPFPMPTPRRQPIRPRIKLPRRKRRLRHRRPPRTRIARVLRAARKAGRRRPLRRPLLRVLHRSEPHPRATHPRATHCRAPQLTGLLRRANRPERSERPLDPVVRRLAAKAPWPRLPALARFNQGQLRQVPLRPVHKLRRAKRPRRQRLKPLVRQRR